MNAQLPTSKTPKVRTASIKLPWAFLSYLGGSLLNFGRSLLNFGRSLLNLEVLGVGSWAFIAELWSCEVVELTRRPPQPAPSTIALFFDPKPRQLHSAAAADARRPTLAMKSMSHAGSGVRWLMVGGRKPRASASAEVTIPAAPLAPCG